MYSSPATYQRRFGFWLSVIGIVAASACFYFLCCVPTSLKALFELCAKTLELEVDEDAFEDMVDFSLAESNKACLAFLLMTIFANLVLLAFPKLTTDAKSGGFWKLYALSCACVVTGYSFLPVFMFANKETLIRLFKSKLPAQQAEILVSFLRPYYNCFLAFICLHILAIASLASLVVASVLTMDEDWHGIIGFFKCLKPYKLVETIPEYKSAYQSPKSQVFENNL